MEKLKRIIKVISLACKTINEVGTSIISMALTIMITIVVVGGLIVLVNFLFKTYSTLLSGN